MAQRTIAHMYDTYHDAQRVVADLEAAGVPHSDISIIANADAQGRPTTTTTTTADTASTGAATGGGAGALLGGAVGGGVGLLAGLGALAIPGVGPVVAAGWLVATLTGAGIGAAGGGLVGSLTGAGVSKDEANVYAEGVRGGGSLVTVRADDSMASRIEDLMQRHSPVDWQQRRASYGSDWAGFDPNAPGRASVDADYDPAITTGRRL